jgi:hypothetical protein
MTAVPNKRLCVYSHSANGKVFYVGRATLSGHMNGLPQLAIRMKIFSRTSLNVVSEVTGDAL